jgi:PKD repeat protein
MNTLFTAENPHDYANIYQYDPLGWTQQINTSQTNPTTGWGANVFTANSNEVLKAISFYTIDLNCNYVINIYTNPSITPISQAGPVLTQSGTIPNAGYHTVPLNSGVKLNAGQTFFVVMEVTNPTYQYPIPVEMPISGYSSQATANASEGFVSSDGNTWTDITTEPSYSNTNLCIKAFTDPESSSLKGLPIANFNANVTNGNVPLTVQFTDLSTNATGQEWNFGYGDNSTELNPTHTYLAAGDYTVNETVSNTNGTDSMLVTINVLTTTSQNTPTITWSKPADIFYGTPLSNVQLDASATDPTTGNPVDGTFAYIPAARTILGVGSAQTLSTTFTPTDTANYTTASATALINVTAHGGNLYPYPGNLYPYWGHH